MTKASTVSIIIPSYNYGKYLAEAIESTLVQTVRPYEIIVINDGSTDSTAEVAAQYADKITYIEQANGGLSNARNIGAKKATGKYLVYLDADDILPADYIEACLTTLNENPKASFIYTQVEYFGTKFGTSKFGEFDAHRLLFGNYIHSASLLARDMVLAHPFDTTFRNGEDWDFYLTVTEHGYIGALCQTTKLRYRRTDSNMNTILEKSVITQLRYMARIMRRHPKSFPITVAAPIFMRRAIIELRNRLRTSR